jgi:hypothetical protein
MIRAAGRCAWAAALGATVATLMLASISSSQACTSCRFLQRSKIGAVIPVTEAGLAVFLEPVIIDQKTKNIEEGIRSGVVLEILPFDTHIIVGNLAGAPLNHAAFWSQCISPLNLGPLNSNITFFAIPRILASDFPTNVPGGEISRINYFRMCDEKSSANHLMDAIRLSTQIGALKDSGFVQLVSDSERSDEHQQDRGPGQNPCVNVECRVSENQIFGRGTRGFLFGFVGILIIGAPIVLWVVRR